MPPTFHTSRGGAGVGGVVLGSRGSREGMYHVEVLVPEDDTLQDADFHVLKGQAEEGRALHEGDQAIVRLADHLRGGEGH